MEDLLVASKQLTSELIRHDKHAKRRSGASGAKS
jgi:hypothetical protein